MARAKKEKTILVKVTAKHIKDGLPYMTSTTDCPVGRAIRGAVHNRGCPEVGTDTLLVGTKDYRLPKAVTAKILQLCYGLPIPPFEFTLPAKIFEGAQ